MTTRIKTSPEDQLLRERCLRSDDPSESGSEEEGRLTFPRGPIINLAEFVIISLASLNFGSKTEPTKNIL